MLFMDNDNIYISLQIFQIETQIARNVFDLRIILFYIYYICNHVKICFYEKFNLLSFQIALYLVMGITTTIGVTSCEEKRPKEFITFEEMADPSIDTLSDWSNVPSGLQASFITIDERVPRSVAPGL